MLTPIIHCLDKNNEAKLNFILSDNGSYQFIKSLKLNNLENIYIWFESKRAFCNLFNLYRKIRKVNFDVAYSTYPSGKRENATIFLSKAKVKYIFRYYKGFFSLWQFLNPGGRVADKSLHDIENNARLFEIPISEMNNKIVKINTPNLPSIGLHIGSRGLSKRWDLSQWVKLIQLLKNFFECNFVLIGGKREKHLIDHVVNNNNLANFNISVVVGEDFPKLMKKLEHLTILVGNDSAVAHICSYLEIPSIVIWSFAQYSRVCPYGKGNIIIKKDYDCVPCFDFTHKKYIDECKDNLKCIKDIKAEEVFEIVKRSLISIGKNKLPTVDNFINIPYVSNMGVFNHGSLLISLKETNNV